MKTEARKFKTFTEVLDFAIEREKEAYTFYERLADTVKKPELVRVIKGLAAEEVEHKIKLEEVRDGRAEIGTKEVGNLRIADYLPNVEPGPDMSYIDLLIVAIKKENLSCRLYTDIAAITGRTDLTDIFLKLAQEEAGHKLRFEFEYDLEKF